MQRYFDYNATTPIDDVVIQSMFDNATHFGNPSSSHRLGREMKYIVESARGHVAHAFGTNAEQIVFTSGGSESNSMIIKGYLQQFYKHPGHLITTSIEHPSILEIVKYLQRQYGFEVTFLPVDRNGFIEVAQVKDSIRENTQLVSVMLANNEIGSIQPIQEISRLTREQGIFLHTDAVQAVGKIPVLVDELGVDALSFSGHKFYGPKGIGGVYLRDRAAFEPLIHGGGQEGGLRCGTENTMSIIGLGAACELLNGDSDSRWFQMTNLKERVIRSLMTCIPDCSINGFDPARSYLPNTINVCIRNVNAKLLASQLSDVYNIYVSTGSACSSNKAKSISHVLQAIGLNETEISSSLRISLGKYTTERDVEYLVSAMRVLVENLRSQVVHA